MISVPWLLPQSQQIDESHKSHNAHVPYPSMHHFGAEMCTFLLKSSALCDMAQVHYGIREIILLYLNKIVHFFRVPVPIEVNNFV